MCSYMVWVEEVKYSVFVPILVDSFSWVELPVQT